MGTYTGYDPGKRGTTMGAERGMRALCGELGVRAVLEPNEGCCWGGNDTRDSEVEVAVAADGCVSTCNRSSSAQTSTLSLRSALSRTSVEGKKRGMCAVTSVGLSRVSSCEMLARG